MGSDLRTDVVVVGSGNAGLCAALAAAQAGAEVVVVEKAPQRHRGGNTAFVSRYRFAYAGLDDLREIGEIDDELAARLLVEPYPESAFFDDLMRTSGGRADPQTMRTIVEDSQSTVRWLAANGMRFEPTMEAAKPLGDKLTWDVGRMLRPTERGTEILRALFAAVQREGVQVVYDCAVTDLLTEAPGAPVRGVVVNGPDGIERVEAGAVILASGGFEASPERRARYLGHNWDVVKVRGTRFNTGECLDMAISHGVATAGQFTGCHATMVHASDVAAELGDELSFPHGYPYSLMVNLAGERFVDEGAGFYAHTYAMYGRAVIDQPQGRAFQLFDASTIPFADTTGVGRYSIEHPVADTVEELAELAGIDREGLVRTVAAYNAAVQDGPFEHAVLDGKRTRGLAVDKTNWATPFVAAPFHAFPVECGLTFTYGGIRTDVDSRALDTRGRPMPGLYAAGEIAGTFYFNYPGGAGLIKGAVQGRRAGVHAAASLVPAAGA
jgi:tricarballylate dehydrogenase